MRNVILNLAVSLDGFIEGPNGEYDWCYTDQDYGMSAFMERIDTIFFGRKSYEVLVRTDNNAYPHKKKFVFSRTLKSVDGADIIRGDIAKEVGRIKEEQGKDIWLFGGAELTGFFLGAGLIDELQLAVHPLLLGRGKPLFSGINYRTGWTLIEARPYSTGLVQLFYRRAQ